MLDFNYRDPRPIYAQLKERLRQMIIAGGIAEGERLPSVRELASQLAINPNTIQRAYRELENEGYLFAIPGKGCFAARQIAGDEKRLDALWSTLDSAVAELRFLGVPPDKLAAHIRGGNDQ